MNYIDWLINVLPPDELTPGNLDEIILITRKARVGYETGAKVKKDNVPKGRLLADLGMAKPKKTVWRRPL